MNQENPNSAPTKIDQNQKGGGDNPPLISLYWQYRHESLFRVWFSGLQFEQEQGKKTIYNINWEFNQCIFRQGGVLSGYSRTGCPGGVLPYSLGGGVLLGL